jgi:hypothetical protein
MTGMKKYYNFAPLLHASRTIFFGVNAVYTVKTACATISVRHTFRTNNLPSTPASPLSLPTPLLPPSPLRFHAPPTPLPIGKLPTSWQKVLCQECQRNSHEISY